MNNAKVSEDKIKKALASIGALVKASEDDLDQPEGADMGNSAKDKMSDEAKSAKSKSADSGEDDYEDEQKGDELSDPVRDHEEEKKADCDKDYDMKSEEAKDEEDDKKEEKKPFPFESKSKKSFAKSLPSEVKTKIEVSDFLKSLVNHTGEAVDGLRASLKKSHSLTHERIEGLEDAIEAVAKSQAAIGVVLKGICEQIGVISKSAARAPKSATVAKGADRSFKSGLEEDGTEGKTMFKSLNKDPMIAKSQITAVLFDLVKSGNAKDLDVINFETSGYIRPELVSHLQEKLN